MTHLFAQPGNGPLLVISLATATLVVALLLAPIRNYGASGWLRSCLLNAAMVTAIFFVTAIFLVTALATVDNGVQIAALLRAAAICFLLLLFPMSVLAVMRGDAEGNRQFIVLILIALLAAPVWLAPIAELSGNSVLLTNVIVAISPLSAFAVALDIDILRTTWFYEHSVLGALRYNYPSWSVYVVIIFTLTILTVIPNILNQERRAKL